VIDFADRHPIVASRPDYLHLSSWVGHIPFGMLVVDLARPKRLVELGTYYGVSYMAFCQAVKALDTGTQCCAVDTWAGDDHIGAYSSDVLLTLKSHHDPAYGSFSTLIQASFDDAAPRFDHEPIDLLHIDGCHRYEAVRHDFETWSRRMSDRGTVLFHDTCERNDEQQFGVWRLWEELSRDHPNFNFTHEHGLGVLAIGKNYPRELDVFFKASPEQQALLRGFFCDLGFRLKNDELVLREAVARGALHGQIDELQRSLGLMKARVQELEEFAAGSSHHVKLLQQQVANLELFGAGMQAERDHLLQEKAALEDELKALENGGLSDFVRRIRDKLA
jgi:hypothetical protein